MTTGYDSCTCGELKRTSATRCYDCHHLEQLRVSIRLECPCCLRMFRVKPSEVHRRRYCSIECRRAASVVTWYCSGCNEVRELTRHQAALRVFHSPACANKHNGRVRSFK